MKIEFGRPYKFAHEGIRVVEYGPGVCDVPEVVGKQAIEGGAGKAAKDPPPAKPDPKDPKAKGDKPAGDGK